MAYTRHNYLKSIRYITSVYVAVKQPDVPDTFIVRHEFPKRGIYISYRTWMSMKNVKQNTLPSIQPTLFGLQAV